MNNSPANAAGGGRECVDPFKRLLRGCFRLVTASMVLGAGLAATNASAQDPYVAFQQAIPLAGEEGTTFTFTVRRLASSGPEITVNVMSSETGDMVMAGDLPTTVTILEDTIDGTFTVRTVDDMEAEDDSTVSIEILAGTGYQLPGTAGGRAQIVTVTDNDDAPPPAASTVTIAAGPSPVTEGAPAEYTLTRTETAGSLTVNVTVSETGEMTADDGSTTVAFADGVAEATLSVATDDDAADEDNSVITAMVDAGDGYTVGTDASATVTVEDNDEAPTSTVTIAAAGPSPVTEGTAAAYTLTRTETVGSLTVNVTVSETGEMTADDGSTTVAFADGVAEATLSVATDDDAADEDNSVITAMVDAGDRYIVGTDASATVTVVDNDEPPMGVSIAADASPVSEGTDATFTLTRTDTADAATVMVSVTETGDMISGTPPATVDFNAGDATATLTVNTDDDDVDEADSDVTATVMPDASYEVAAPDSATVTVTDNDALPVETGPYVAFDQVASFTAEEGAVLEFTVRRLADEGPAVTVNLMSSESGDMVAAGGLPTEVTIPEDVRTATFTISTVDDTEDEADSTVAVEIQPGGGYRVPHDHGRQDAGRDRHGQRRRRRTAASRSRSRCGQHRRRHDAYRRGNRCRVHADTRRLRRRVDSHGGSERIRHDDLRRCAFDGRIRGWRSDQDDQHCH